MGSAMGSAAAKLVVALVAVAMLAAGCVNDGGPDAADQSATEQRPEELAFGSPAEAPGTTLNSPQFGPEASGYHSFEVPTAADGLTLSQPPLTLPLHVATATVDDVWSYQRPLPSAEPDQWFPNPTQFGGPRVFQVIDQASNPDFVQVSLPSKPNGQVGWVKRTEVELSTVEHQAMVDLSDRTVTVWNGDRVISRSGAVTGTPWTPTPLGVFFVRDIIRQANPSGAYGPYILALSGFSETLESFDGGLPAIAIHGTNNPSLIGQQRSNGCVRVPNDIIEFLAANVPLGTPVVIVA